MNNKSISWNEISWFLQKQSYEISSPYNTGFNTWPIKQEMYKLKDQLDALISEAPTYAGEEEWLEEQRTNRAIEKLAR